MGNKESDFDSDSIATKFGNIKPLGLVIFAFVNFVIWLFLVLSGLLCPLAVEIHDRQRLMDPSPVPNTPPVEEEDEWGM